MAAARRGSSAAASSGRPSRSTPARAPSTSAPAPGRRTSTTTSIPGPNPRANSLIAVDLNTGKQRWWQQLVANDQWNYDVAQPPLVYDAKVGGKTRRVVSVATKEGVWFAFDARSGQPLHERVKVIDRVEHPPLRPGQPVTIFPSALGGVNYSPASYDPATELRLQRRGGDGRRPDPGQADADAEAAEADPGRRLPRAPERELRHRARRAGTTTARSARSTSPPASGSGSSRRPSRSAAASRRPRAASASPAAATASCARSTSGTGRCSGASRPARRSRPGRRSI